MRKARILVLLVVLFILPVQAADAQPIRLDSLHAKVQVNTPSLDPHKYQPHLQSVSYELTRAGVASISDPCLTLVPNTGGVEIRYNPLCQACGKTKLTMRIKALTILHKIETILKNYEITIPCEADVLLVSQPVLLDSDSYGTKAGKLRSVWTQIIKYMDRANKQGLSTRYVELWSREDIAYAQGLARLDYFDETSLEEYVKKIRWLRARIKPTYLIILGQQTSIPSITISNKDGRYTSTVYSDDAYGAPLEVERWNEHMPNIVVARIPGANLEQLEQMLRTITSNPVKVNGAPAVVRLSDDQPFAAPINERARQLITFYGTKNVIYSPAFCADEFRREGCKSGTIYSELEKHRVMLFQTHSFSSSMLGEMSSREEHEYYTIVNSGSILMAPPTLSLPQLFLLMGCNSANTAGESNDHVNQPLFAASLLLKGASTVIGYSGVSTTVYTIPSASGRLSQPVRVGDEWLKAKQGLTTFRSQRAKLSLVGDPLLLYEVR